MSCLDDVLRCIISFFLFALSYFRLLELFIEINYVSCVTQNEKAEDG